MAPSIHYHDAVNALREIALYGDTAHIGCVGMGETRHLAVEILLAPAESSIIVDNAPPYNPLGTDIPTESDKLVALIKEAYLQWCKKRGRSPKEI